MTNLQQAHTAYLAAALWTAMDAEGDPLGLEYLTDDIHPDSADASLTEVRRVHHCRPQCGPGCERTGSRAARP